MNSEEKIGNFLVELAELTHRYDIAITEQYHNPNLSDTTSEKYIARELQYDFASGTYTAEAILETEN